MRTLLCIALLCAACGIAYGLNSKQYVLICADRAQSVTKSEFDHYRPQCKKYGTNGRDESCIL